MPPPSRRSVLAAASAALATAAAGCLSVSDASPPTDLAVRAVDTDEYRNVPWTPEVVPDGVDARPFTGFGIGDERTDDGDEPPHCVWVWNGSGREREFTVEFAADADTVFERSLTFEAGACAGFVLFTPTTYTVAVGGGAWRQTADVEASWFDCNASTTDVVVVEDGRLEVGTITQDMACSE